MQRRVRWWSSVVAGMLLLGVTTAGAAPVPRASATAWSEAEAVDADSTDPAVMVPDVLGQFENLQLHGDPLAFNLGVGDDPATCRHYQGLARVDTADGTPYLILTRSGNYGTLPGTVISTCGPPGAYANYPGELLVVEMGSRTGRSGERLRSNLLSPAYPMAETVPPAQDRGVAHFHFDGSFGESAPDVSDGPRFSHLGGIQVVDDVLVVALEKECTGGYSGDCDSELTERGAVALIDVSDPTRPELLHWQYLPGMEAVGVVGATYVAPDQHPTRGDRYLFVMTWGDSSELRFAWSNTGDLRTTTSLDLEPFAWHEAVLGGNQDKWREWQTLNIVRDPSYPAVRGLIGADKDGSEDWLGLFALDVSKVTSTEIAGAILYAREKHLQLNGPDMGSLDAASGVYVSPTGQFILYTAPHDNEAAGGSVEMGEFRNIDVYQAGTEAVDTMCPWVELYEDPNGWADGSPGRSLMLDFEDRNLDSWHDLEGEDFGDEPDALRWYRAPGQVIGLFEDDVWRGAGLALHIYPAGAVLSLANLDDLSWGDRISSVKMFPYADPGGPYTGSVDAPVLLGDANPCLTADSAVPPVEFSWTVDTEACTFSDPTARRPQLTCDAAGTFDVTLQVLSPGEWPLPFAATTEVTITEPTNQPPVVRGFTVTVLEDVAVGTPLGTVSGSDADHDPLSFAITAGNGDGLFRVDATTGRVSVAAPLDYETETRHVLTVEVSDGVSTAGAVVTVLVLDVNELPEPGDTFTDDDDSVFEADIEWLAAAGITKGCGPTTFCPGDFVTRGQMAAFLGRALGYTDDGGGDLFVDDDDSVFEADIDRLASAGVTRGCDPPVNSRFCPDDFVTRGQMAAFLHRALGD